MLQYRIHDHYGQQSHNGIDDWHLTLIEQFKTHNQLKERETSQLTFTCFKSTTESLKKVGKYAQS